MFSKVFFNTERGRDIASKLTEEDIEFLILCFTQQFAQQQEMMLQIKFDAERKIKFYKEEIDKLLTKIAELQQKGDQDDSLFSDIKDVIFEKIEDEIKDKIKDLFSEQGGTTKDKILDVSEKDWEKLADRLAMSKFPRIPFKDI